MASASTSTPQPTGHVEQTTQQQAGQMPAQRPGVPGAQTTQTQAQSVPPRQITDLASI